LLPSLPTGGADLLGRSRVFSVGDLLRVMATPAGRASLEILKLGVDLDVLADQAGMFALPAIPAWATPALVGPDPGLGVASVHDFLERDPAALAAALAAATGRQVAEAEVRGWQREVRDSLAA
jgi:hypothetical protein